MASKKSGNHNDLSKRGAATPVSKGAGHSTGPVGDAKGMNSIPKGGKKTC